MPPNTKNINISGLKANIAGVCKTSDVELNKCKSDHPTLDRREILRFHKYSPSYSNTIRHNERIIQDLLTKQGVTKTRNGKRNGKKRNETENMQSDIHKLS